MEARSALFASVVTVFALLTGPVWAGDHDADDSVASLGAGAGGAGDCEGRPSNTKLIVQVSQLRSAQGEVAVTVYPSDPQRFLAPRGKLLRARVKAVAPTTQACFYLPGPDAYAVAIYHDANANRGFDRNGMGMPIEGFAFSNDAPTKFGVPSFDAARFTVKAGETVLRVKMRYTR
jgi:uncharacterized protein (DUF2141 family)